MANPRLKNVFQFCEGCSYLTLVCLGAYIIQQGHVLQKYRLHRTNFAEYAENIAELPTVFAWLSPFHPSLKLGQNFEICYRESKSNAMGKGIQPSWENGTCLKLGKNKINNLILKCEEIGGEDTGSQLMWPNNIGFHLFKLTPLNFSPGIITISRFYGFKRLQTIVPYNKSNWHCWADGKLFAPFAILKLRHIFLPAALVKLYSCSFFFVSFFKR